MLSFLPILGPFIQGLIVPIFQGVTGLFSKYWDTKLATTQTEAKTEIAMAQESTKAIELTHDDWGVRLCRDLVIFPPSVWVACTFWDKIIEHHYPWLVVETHDVPTSLAFVPYAVLTFLLGRAALYTWNNK